MLIFLSLSLVISFTICTNRPIDCILCLHRADVCKLLLMGQTGEFIYWIQQANVVYDFFLSSPALLYMSSWSY